MNWHETVGGVEAVEITIILKRRKKGKRELYEAMTKRKKEKVKRFLPGKSRWEKPKQNQLDGGLE